MAVFLENSALIESWVAPHQRVAWWCRGDAQVSED